jgi:hypothetical protein
MNAHAIGPLVAAVGVLLGATQSSLAHTEADAEWTVLTVARSGAWGLSTARLQSEAIAGALRQCRSRPTVDSDCGAELLAYKAGWGLAILCGDHRVMVASKGLEEANALADARVAALRQSYGSSLPPCHRLLTVDPEGGVMTASPSGSASISSSDSDTRDGRR